jgi:hypothetical protein
MTAILTLDIETAPLEAYTWGLWDQNVGLDQIKTEWSILSYCAKWLNNKKLIYRDTGGKGVKRVRDDAGILDDIWHLLDNADIVVAQNGNRFDIRKINARLLMHGYGPYSPIRTIDTLTVAKKYFGFSSNKLAWMSKHLTDTPKSDHRDFPGFELWVECLKDNPKAWEEMKTYNQIDTVACEQLYLKLRPWITNHPNLGAYSDADGKPACPKCGSADIQKRGFSTTQNGKYQRFQCQGCGGWSRSKSTVLTVEERKVLLV